MYEDLCSQSGGGVAMKALIVSEKKDGVDSIHLADNNPIILAVRLIAQIVLWIESFKVIYSITSQCKWCSVEEEDSFTAWNASPIPGGKMISSDRIKVRGSFSFIITV